MLEVGKGDLQLNSGLPYIKVHASAKLTCVLISSQHFPLLPKKKPKECK